MSEHIEICLERCAQAGVDELQQIVAADWGKPSSVEIGEGFDHRIFASANIGRLTFKRAMLAVLHHNNQLDVELTLDIRDIQTTNAAEAMTTLMDLTRRWADITSAKDWYAGLEPASDTQTRCFTREEPGPLFSMAAIGFEKV